MSHACGTLGTSQKQAIITLIEKSGKDTRYLNGWRPISLINVDCKIISKILVSRIKQYLPRLINSDQTAFVDGRYIGGPVRIISDVLEYTKNENIEGILFAADYAAAFDTVDLCFLYAVLHKFGFPPYFIRWIRILHSNSESCVINNGYTTGYFKISRGTRQGDPLAAYLFILIIEILATMIRNENHIEGIRIKEKFIKQCFYANDATFFLKDKQSLGMLLNVIEQFSKYSSLKLNKTKSEIAWIGAKRFSVEQIGTFPLTNLTQQAIKILGIYFTYDTNSRNKLDFDKVETKLKRMLDTWKQRQLTIFGRKEIVGTLALSQVYYVTNMLDPPENNLKRIKQLILDFIWNGRRPKIKYNSLIGPHDKGGITLPDIYLKIKTQRIKWVQNLLQNNLDKWKIIPLHYMTKVINTTFIRSSFDTKYLPLNLPDFYRNAMQVWAEFAHGQPMRARDVLIQPLWCNKHINLCQKYILNKELMSIGIGFIFIGDIVKSDGVLKQLHELVAMNSDIYKRQFLNWCSLIRSIPKEWLTLIENNRNITELTSELTNSVLFKQELIQMDSMNSPQIYKLLLENIFEEPTAKSKINCNNSEWKEMCSNIYKTSIDTW